jgi:hypothetical protein
VLGAVVVLVVLGAAGCQPDRLPVGARLAPGGQAEAFFRSCDGVPLQVVLDETDRPDLIDEVGVGTTPPPPWTATWSGTVDGGATSTVIPVVLHPDRGYRIRVDPDDPAARRQVDSDPVVFVVADLDAVDVTSSRPRGGQPIPPEVFADSTATACTGPAVPVPPVAIAAGAVACVFLVPVVVIIVLAARAAGRRRTGSPDVTAGGAPRGRP